MDTIFGCERSSKGSQQHELQLPFFTLSVFERSDEGIGGALIFSTDLIHISHNRSSDKFCSCAYNKLTVTDGLLVVWRNTCARLNFLTGYRLYDSYRHLEMLLNALVAPSMKLATFVNQSC